MPIVLGDISADHRRVTGRTTASIDRIVSRYPNGQPADYTLDNIQWVHKTINRMKNKYSDAVFIRFCEHVAKCRGETD